jgi:hypothetical protein
MPEDNSAVSLVKKTQMLEPNVIASEVMHGLAPNLPQPDKIRRVCSFLPAQLEPTDLPPTLNYHLGFKRQQRALSPWI